MNSPVKNMVVTLLYTLVPTEEDKSWREKQLKIFKTAAKTPIHYKILGFHLFFHVFWSVKQINREEVASVQLCYDGFKSLNSLFSKIIVGTRDKWFINDDSHAQAYSCPCACVHMLEREP